MLIVDDLKALNGEQRSAFTASLLGWTLDAFDFFILIFIVKDIADDFKVQVSAVSLAIALTLMMRPAGAFVFGWLADRFGRRPVLMADVLLFAGLELASGFAPNLPTLLVLRLLFGFAMGGEWGIGASLALESIPARSRGVVSGLLQQGYPFGYLLAAVAHYFVGAIGWRGMFIVGVAPALLVLYIRQFVKESPAFEAARDRAREAKAQRGPPPALAAADRTPVLAMLTLSLLGALIALPIIQAFGGLGDAAPPLPMTGHPVLAIGSLLILAVGVAFAYATHRRGSPEQKAYARYALATFWLGVAGAVLGGLILFSVSKPFRELHLPLGYALTTMAALLALWFVARGAYGLAKAGSGVALRPTDPSSFFGSRGGHWPRLLYVVILMTAFNFFSHGTQDLYPTFLKVQHHFDAGLVSTLTIIGNLGAIVGGVTFGTLSERLGRRRAIALAAVLALPIIPLWAFTATPLLLGLGAFLIQISVQGAWGVVPVHLNELSPDAARGTFPGFAYQLGNLIASGNAVIQAGVAESHGNNYGLALAIVAGVVAVTLALLSLLGPEAKGVRFGGGDAPA